MPEEEGRPRRRGFSFGQVAAVVIVVAVVEALVLSVALRQNPAASAAPPKPAGSKAPEEELRAPAVPLGDVFMAFPVDTTGEQVRRLVVSVHLKLGREVGEDGQPKDENEKLDLGYLTSVYLPKVKELLPKAREELRMIVAGLRESREIDFLDLYKPRNQVKIMKTLRNRVNAKLADYGVEPRVVEVWCEQFTFE